MFDKTESPSDSARTQVERWIFEHLDPVPSTTAELAYERMESQSGRCLAVIYQPLDHRKRAHWHDVAIVGAFAYALRGAGTVLDIGPGDGWPCLRMADRFDLIAGIDPSPRRVRVQKENAARLGIENVEFSVGDAVALPFRDASFGGVTAASAIEQSDDPVRALREVFRVLKPGGTLAMVFEDYDTYFPDSKGDEELWSEFGLEDTTLFYQVRTKTPPRETCYALFIDRVLLGSADEDLRGEFERLARDRTCLENADIGPERTGHLDVPFFERLRPLVAETKWFELRHLTSASLDTLLMGVGFTDVKHLDHRMPAAREFWNAAEEAGRLDEFAGSFGSICELMGAAAVRGAGKGPGDFVVARKPQSA